MLEAPTWRPVNSVNIWNLLGPNFLNRAEPGLFSEPSEETFTQALLMILKRQFL